MPRPLFPTLLLVLAAAGAASAQAPSILLTTSANPATYGQPITLSTSVTLANDGNIAFYDGATLLAIRPLTAGHATFTTALLPAGARQLRAALNTTTSAPLLQTITTNRLNDFRDPDRISPSNTSTLLLADFNADTSTDLAAPNLPLFQGVGDGTFTSARTFISSGASAVGDFNEDGNLDIAPTVSSNSATVTAISAPSR